MEGKLPSLTAVQSIVKAKVRSLKTRSTASSIWKTGSSPPKVKQRRATSAHSDQILNKWKKETMQQAVEGYRASRMPGYQGDPVSCVVSFLKCPCRSSLC